MYQRQLRCICRRNRRPKGRVDAQVYRALKRLVESILRWRRYDARDVMKKERKYNGMKGGERGNQDVPVWCKWPRNGTTDGDDIVVEMDGGEKKKTKRSRKWWRAHRVELTIGRRKAMAKDTRTGDTLLEEVGGEKTHKDHDHRWWMSCVLFKAAS